MPNVRSRLSMPAVIVLGLAACQSVGGTAPPAASASPPATQSPTPTSGAISHPTEPNAVVLRMEQTGGFVPIEFNATRLPTFTLYGDGTVIYQPSLPAFDPGVVREPLRKATMTEEQIQALLTYALGRGRLLDAREHYPNPLVADAPSTVFTIDAAGVTKTVTVDALEEGEPTTTEDVVERRAFGQLMTTLNTFSEAVQSGEAVDAGDYEPTAYRGVLIEAQGMAGEMRDWPWEDLAPEDFETDEEFGFPSATLTPEQAAAVVDDPSGGVMGIGVTGPDRAPHTINIRPLLPDEIE